MPDTFPILFASLGLLGVCANILVVCLRHRRDPGPAFERIVQGLGLGIGLGVALVGIMALIATA